MAKEREFLKKCDFTRERGQDLLDECRLKHKDKFTKERDETKKFEEKYKNQYKKYQYKEMEKNRKLKEKKMKKKLQTKWKEIYGPMNHEKMNDQQKEYLKNLEAEKQKRLEKLKETQTQRMKFFELHPKPEYKHPFYESYKKEFKNMKQKNQLKREQMQKRLEARDEYVEKVVKDLNAKAS